MRAPDEIAQKRGLPSLTDSGWRARLLPSAPLIAPARQYIFPQAVPGEEEAMARGSVWLEVKAEGQGDFLAQCAIGFAGPYVASGLWTSPVPGEFVLLAGGYAYAVAPLAPEQTALLPMRPVLAVAEVVGRIVLVGYHALLVRESNGATWLSDRLSWEGVTVTGVDAERELLRGTGWDMLTDEEIPFALDLRTHALLGGGYRRA